MTPPAVLTIAGSDSCGGAGIQADLKTFMMQGCYGASVITALTAQNTLGVSAIHAPDAAFVGQQLEAVLADIPVRAAKTGMLFNAAIVSVVAKALSHESFPLVVDPVCVSQSGHALLEGQAAGVILAELFPLAALVTPNRPEAELLSGMVITDRDSLFAAMEKLLSCGPGAVLIKGGHMEERDGLLTDWLGRPGRDPLPLPMAKVDTPHTHGTGCTLSAAIAARLALGEDMETAIRSAQKYLHLALSTGFAVGRGASPPNHLAPYLACQGS